MSQKYVSQSRFSLGFQRSKNQSFFVIILKITRSTLEYSSIEITAIRLRKLYIDGFNERYFNFKERD